MYEFKMPLFDNKEPEEFLLFMWNLNMTLGASGTIKANVKLQYLRTLLCGEALPQFDILCDQVRIMIMAHFNQVIFGLGTYFYPVNSLSKKTKCATE